MLSKKDKRDQQKLDKEKDREKDKDKEKDKDREKGEKDKEKDREKDKGTKKKTNSTQSSQQASQQQIYTLWVKVMGDEYDSVPIDVDSSLTVHELKKYLQGCEELDLIGFKLYLLKIFYNDKPLNVKGRLVEVLQNNDEIEIQIGLPPSVGMGTAGSHSGLLGPSHFSLPILASPGGGGGPLVESGLFTPRGDDQQLQLQQQQQQQDKSVKKEVTKLRKQVAELTSLLDPKDENGQLGTVLTDVKARLDQLQQRQNELGNLILKVGPSGAANDRTPQLDNRIPSLPTIKAKETLSDHAGPISTLVANDELLFSGSTDMTVKVWEINTLKVKHTFTGHTQQVTTISKSNDNKMICSGSSDCSIKVWDVENLNCSSTINTGKDIRSVFWYRGMVFSGHLKTVLVWDIKKKKMVKELPGQDHWVRSILVANGYCFTAAQNIQIWDMGSFSCLKTLAQIKCGSIYCLGLYEDWMLAGTYEQKLLIWDTKSYEFVVALKHPGPIYALAINGPRVYTGCYDHSIYEWDIRMLSYPSLVRSYVGHSSTVDALCFVNDKLFSGSADGTIKTWRPPILTDVKM